MKGIGKPCDGERHARCDEGAMEKCQVHGRARVCKLPAEADRAEMLSLVCHGNSPSPNSTGHPETGGKSLGKE